MLCLTDFSVFICFPSDTEVCVGPLSLMARLGDGLRGSVIRFRQRLAMGLFSKTFRPAMGAQPSIAWVTGLFPRDKRVRLMNLATRILLKSKLRMNGAISPLTHSLYGWHRRALSLQVCFLATWDVLKDAECFVSRPCFSFKQHCNLSTFAKLIVIKPLMSVIVTTILRLPNNNIIAPVRTSNGVRQLVGFCSVVIWNFVLTL
jgi:hypothetical protein